MKSGRYLVLSTVFAILILGGCMSSGPAGTVKKFYRLVEDGKVQDAADMFSGEAVALFGRDKVVAGLSEQTREISGKDGIKSITILDEEVSGQVAEIKVRVEYGNGESEQDTVQLTKLDGKWMLTPNMEK